MKLEDIQQAILRIGLSVEQSQAFLQLIDAKIDDDMKEVINEIRNQNVELRRLEDKLDTRFSLILWVMGIMMALMLALKFFAA